MKICIISVINSPNQGSYQQLKELGDAYSAYGTVYYLDNGTRKIFSDILGYVLGCLRKGKIKKAIFEVKRRLIFKKRYKNFKRINIDQINKMDLVVLGSDEIWNYKRDTMKHPILWGSGISNMKVSFAPSIGGSDLNTLRDAGFVLEALNQLDMVSVRDENSRLVLKELGYEGEIEILADPSLLKSKEDYRKESTCNFPDPYLALYCFQGFLDINSDAFEFFEQFAKNKGLRFVSFGIWSDYAENFHSDSSGAFDFMLNADFVITNTFHGTAFAINFNKQFITFSSGREEKIKNLLKECGLEDRDCTNQSIDSIMRIMNTPIDYSTINCKLEQMRKKSHDFIRRTVEHVRSK